MLTLPPRAALPSFSTIDEYRKLYKQDVLFQWAAEAIRDRHRITAPCIRFKAGSNLVYGLGRSLVLKLYAPLFHEEYRAEREALSLASTALTVPMPDIVAEGDFEGWPYLLLRRLSGHAPYPVWKEVPEGDRHLIVTELGQQLAALHRVAVPSNSPLRVNWPVFIRSQHANAAWHHGREGAPEAWLEGLPAFLARWAPPVADESDRVLLHADLTDDNLVIGRRKGHWRLTGFLDFADALVGDRHYEWAAPALCYCRGDATLLHSLLSAYGQPVLDDEFIQRLLGWTLLHRFGNLKYLVARAPTVAPGNFDALARALFGDVRMIH